MNQLENIQKFILLWQHRSKWCKLFFYLEAHLVFLHVSVSDLSEWHVKSSAVALVDGQPWHMHRPLTRSCDLTLLTFKDEDPQIVNKVIVTYQFVC